MFGYRSLVTNNACKNDCRNFIDAQWLISFKKKYSKMTSLNYFQNKLSRSKEIETGI